MGRADALKPSRHEGDQSAALPLVRDNIARPDDETDSPLISRRQYRGSLRSKERIMVDQEVFDSQIKTDRFPFPSESDITERLVIRETGECVLRISPRNFLNLGMGFST